MRACVRVRVCVFNIAWHHGVIDAALHDQHWTRQGAHVCMCVRVRGCVIGWRHGVIDAALHDKH